MSYIFYNFGIPFSSETSKLKHKDYVSILIDIFVVTANLVALKDNK